MIMRGKLLNDMGIIQWKLRNPMVLKGEHGLFIPESTQLLIITDKYFNFKNLLIEDIFRAMMIERGKVYCLLASKISLLKRKFFCPCWIIGKYLDVSSKKWVIHTLSLKEIYYNPQLKRDLWMQIHEKKANATSRSN